MKNNGFTLVELLAVMVIMGLLIVITIPAYSQVYSSIKRNNYTSKLSEIKAASLKYGNEIKDEVKNKGTSCYDLTVADLIVKGYIMSESEAEPTIFNPTNGKALNGTIKLCYCTATYDISSYYTEEFNANTYYYEGEYVTYNNNIYKCNYTYPGQGGIEATKVIKKSNGVEEAKKYFELITPTNC